MLCRLHEQFLYLRGFSSPCLFSTQSRVSCGESQVYDAVDEFTLLYLLSALGICLFPRVYEWLYHANVHIHDPLSQFEHVSSWLAIGIVPRVRASSIMLYKGIRISEEVLLWLLTFFVSLSSRIGGVIELFVGMLFANYALFPLLQKKRLVPFPSMITNFIIYYASSSEEPRDRNISEDSSSPFMVDAGFFGRGVDSSEESSPPHPTSQAHVEELMVRRVGEEVMNRVLVLVDMNVNMLCSPVATM